MRISPVMATHAFGRVVRGKSSQERCTSHAFSSGHSCPVGACEKSVRRTDVPGGLGADKGNPRMTASLRARLFNRVGIAYLLAIGLMVIGGLLVPGFLA